MENLDKANELFDELKERCLVYDGVVNATFMDWFFNRGREIEAMESYKSLLDRQYRMIPATCNTLLEVLLKHEKKPEAWSLFHQMLDNHTPPTFQAVNSDTFNIMVNECFKLGEILEAMNTFKKAGTKQGSKPYAMDIAGYNNIIARFCENDMLSDAEQLFTELCSKSLTPDVTTYRTFINAYLKLKRFDNVLQFFNKMVEVGLRVVASFGNMVFNVFMENGKAVECAEILKRMGNNEIKPDVTCYETVVKGVCSAGELDAGRDLLGQMMTYNIGIPDKLREFVTEVFGKAGRGEEVERIFNMSRYAPNHRPSEPPQMGGQARGLPDRQVRRLQNQAFNFGRSAGPAVGESYGPAQMAGSVGRFEGNLSGPPQMAGSASSSVAKSLVSPQRYPQNASSVPSHVAGSMRPSHQVPHMVGQVRDQPPSHHDPHMVGQVRDQPVGYPQNASSVPSHVAGQVNPHMTPGVTLPSGLPWIAGQSRS